MKKIPELIYTYPVLALILAGAVALGAYFTYSTISDYLFERRAEQHEIEQDRQREKVDGFKVESEADARAGESKLADAERVEADVMESKKNIKDKKAYANKVKADAEVSSTRDIGDSDVPSNAELCARANSLGIRCDFNR